MSLCKCIYLYYKRCILLNILNYNSSVGFGQHFQGNSQPKAINPFNNCLDLDAVKWSI